MSKKLYLSLDQMWDTEYYYTDYDIGGNGHSITIKESDREAFLDAFAERWRDRAESFLEELEDEDKTKEDESYNNNWFHDSDMEDQ